MRAVYEMSRVLKYKWQSLMSKFHTNLSSTGHVSALRAVFWKEQFILSENAIRILSVAFHFNIHLPNLTASDVLVSRFVSRSICMSYYKIHVSRLNCSVCSVFI